MEELMKLIEIQIEELLKAHPGLEIVNKNDEEIILERFS
jgi:hypothetical protein